MRVLRYWRGWPEVARLGSGVPGLDLVLGGGLEGGELVVVAGSPGTGKTILAQQICFSRGTSAHAARYFTTLSEPTAKLVRHLEPFSFFDVDALEQRVEFLNLGGLLEDGEGAGLEAAFGEITRRVFESEPSVVVIDSSKALPGCAPGDDFRRLVYELAARVAHSQAVLVFVGEYTLEEMEALPEFAIAYTIIWLAREPVGPIDRQWLRVIKVRGAAPLQGQHSFQIGPDGAVVFPRLESTLPVRGPLSEQRISIGVAAIDELLGGGIPSGDATLLLGPSGVGKTILALRFLAQGLEQGEPGVYVSFQETEAQLLAKAANFGWDLTGPLASGQLRILAIPPVEVSLDALGAALRERVGEMDGGRVVLDSLAELAYAARQTERLPAYTWSIATIASSRGASTLITSETALIGASELTAGLSFLFQNMILLRFYEAGSRLSRALSVLKMRDSDHADSHAEFVITDAGVELREVLTGLSGVLGFTTLTTDRPFRPTP
jgi:circadian clock protein KaiC